MRMIDEKKLIERLETLKRLQFRLSRIERRV